MRARRRADFDCSVGRDQRHRIVRSRIGVRDGAADRAEGTHGRIGNDARGLREQRRSTLRGVQRGELGVRRHRADAQAAVIFLRNSA